MNSPQLFITRRMKSILHAQDRAAFIGDIVSYVVNGNGRLLYINVRCQWQPFFYEQYGRFGADQRYVVRVTTFHFKRTRESVSQQWRHIPSRGRNGGKWQTAGRGGHNADHAHRNDNRKRKQNNHGRDLYYEVLVLISLARTSAACMGNNCVAYRRSASDDILLIAPSIGELQRLLINCERELEWLDMHINIKKITLLAHWSSI